MYEVDLNEQNIRSYLRKIALGYGWVDSTYYKAQWWRLEQLQIEIKKKGVSYNLVKEAFENLVRDEKKAGRTGILRNFPKNLELLNAIDAKIASKESLKYTKGDLITKENHLLWLQSQARAKQWNTEHHEELVKGTKQPRMADPDWAYGRRKPS